MKSQILLWKDAFGVKSDPQLAEIIGVSLACINRWKYAGGIPQKGTIEMIETLIWSQTIPESWVDGIDDVKLKNFKPKTEEQLNNKLLYIAYMGEQFVRLRAKNKGITRAVLEDRVYSYQNAMQGKGA